MTWTTVSFCGSFIFSSSKFQFEVTWLVNKSSCLLSSREQVYPLSQWLRPGPLSSLAGSRRFYINRSFRSGSGRTDSISNDSGVQSTICRLQTNCNNKQVRVKCNAWTQGNCLATPCSTSTSVCSLGFGQRVNSDVDWLSMRRKGWAHPLIGHVDDPGVAADHEKDEGEEWHVPSVWRTGSKKGERRRRRDGERGKVKQSV